MIVLQVLVFLLGVGIVLETLLSMVRTFVLPRAAPDPISRVVFLAIRRLFNFRLHFAQSYKEKDSVMAYYGPVSVLALLPCWLALIVLGYSAMYWGLGYFTLVQDLRLSSYSLFALGGLNLDRLATMVLGLSEAVIGLLMIALLIAYLPTMYTAFSRREAAVALLEVRAGNPPSALGMLLRFHRIHGLNHLGDQWKIWEPWFVDLEESHTSLAALVFFRSPQPEHSWVTAAGTILDTAALANAALNIPHDPQADLTIRAGYLALRRIADFFRVEYDPNPRPSDPISITRTEFDQAIEQFSQEGVPLKADRDKAWKDFAGWRVNYDTVLLALAELTLAPQAAWIKTPEPKEKRVLKQKPAVKRIGGAG